MNKPNDGEYRIGKKSTFRPITINRSCNLGIAAESKMRTL